MTARSSSIQTGYTHVCRHTYASVLLMSGAALVSVQRLLGHSDPKITERPPQGAHLERQQE